MVSKEHVTLALMHARLKFGPDSERGRLLESILKDDALIKEIAFGTSMDYLSLETRVVQQGGFR